MFAPGEVIARREVLHGHLWLSHPVTVVADDGDVLATRLDPGSPRFSYRSYAESWSGWRDTKRSRSPSRYQIARIC